MKRVEIYIGIMMLVFALGFNLWLYRMEPTAKVDPNDNTFQYALVERTNQIWDFANKKCSAITKPFCVLAYLSDHWVPNWAEGYNLPYYYSHIPQIVIVGSWRLLSWFSSLFTIHYSLFSYYHWVIYVLLSFFPLSVFLALSIAGLSPLSAGLGAITATQISTDGLYGLDPASFLWRGYGLSSQLFAMIWLPPALAYAYKWFSGKHIGHLIPAVLFLAATTAGHLGIGIIAFLSVGIIGIAPSVRDVLTNRWDKQSGPTFLGAVRHGSLLLSGVLLLLGYWIIPVLKDGNYHNISVWDPIWKFDSYGYREILKNLLNGDLFDFGRFPTLTILTLVGLFAAVTSETFPFALLFLFWLFLYFGRTTWGGLVNIIPGMEEFHISRFIVGVQAAGLFLIPIGIEWMLNKIYQWRKYFRIIVSCVIAAVLVVLISPQTYRYAAYNDSLITRANTNYDAQIADVNLLANTLRPLQISHPGRVFMGRGGAWGKQLKIAETPYYMYLSTYGTPTVLWLPETWSPNSDTEQYFRENVEADYSLYNIRYVVTPIGLAQDQVQPFWKPLTASKTWKLYEVPTTGYFTTGVRPAIVSTTKENYLNVVRLWIQSDFPKEGLYPELTFDQNYPMNSGLPNFRMIDEITYRVPDGSIHNLFAENPRYLRPAKTQVDSPKITFQSDDHDMRFSATVEVPIGCNECIVILKQSFHPSWLATIDGKSAPTFTVFPFFTAVKVVDPGTHTITVSYQPSVLKQLLLVVALITLGFICWLSRSNGLKK